jgi:ABC-type uncharacterized transport system permease subunit
MADDERPPVPAEMTPPDKPVAAAPTGIAGASDIGPKSEGPQQRWLRVRRTLRAMVLPALAVFSALVIGAIVIVASDQEVIGLLTRDPLAGLGAAWTSVASAYGALFRGSIGDPVQIFNALVSLDIEQLKLAMRPISETLLSSTPLILTGLAVALAFRSGLFNIGGEGQLQMGALSAAVVGFSLVGQPWFIHLPLALLAGALGGAVWGFIPGLLKARTGAHEVITTIMLNFVAFRVVDLALKTPGIQREGRSDPISKIIQPTAVLTPIIDGLRVHWGLVVALVAAILVSWLLFRSTKGFEFRAVGLNPQAARYAGMNIGRTIVLTMMSAGTLAGLGGAVVVLGVTGTMTPGLAGGAGFDGIAIALLGRARPAGVVAAALLVGALRAGSTPMQAATGVPIHLVAVIQALVILFIAAPALVRAIYRIRTERVVGSEAFAKGWGS